MNFIFCLNFWKCFRRIFNYFENSYKARSNELMIKLELIKTTSSYAHYFNKN